MPMKLEELVGHVAGRFVQGLRPSDPITRVYANILRRFGEHALSKWASVSGAGVRCALHLQAHPMTGRPGICAAFAAGCCVACQRTVCLMHALAGAADGTLICHGCVADARVQKGAPASAQPPQPAENDYQERLRYLAVLECGPDAVLADIKRAYKRLAREHHPDGKTGRAQERAEARMRDLNVAYHWLMDKGAAYAAA